MLPKSNSEFWSYSFWISYHSLSLSSSSILTTLSPNPLFDPYTHLLSVYMILWSFDNNSINAEHTKKTATTSGKNIIHRVYHYSKLMGGTH